MKHTLAFLGESSEIINYLNDSASDFNIIQIKNPYEVFRQFNEIDLILYEEKEEVDNSIILKNLVKQLVRYQKVIIAIKKISQTIIFYNVVYTMCIPKHLMLKI